MIKNINLKALKVIIISICLFSSVALLWGCNIIADRAPLSSDNGGIEENNEDVKDDPLFDELEKEIDDLFEFLNELDDIDESELDF